MKILHISLITNIFDKWCKQKQKAANKILLPLEALNIIKNTDRKDLFTILWIALYILLIFPVTVASSECSFSMLKLIKTYLRTSMTQKWLTLLVILYLISLTYYNSWIKYINIYLYGRLVGGVSIKVLVSAQKTYVTITGGRVAP